jgi:hypothetical protein
VTDYEQVINVFYSEIRNRHELPESLLNQWFVMAVRDYGLDISPLGYDAETQMFAQISGAAINTLGLMMSVSYLKRERSRIGKLNNIIGKDIQLNATGDAKKAVKAEYDDLIYEVEQKLFKQKRHAFN